ncbi:uncharacterized protein F5147DRAFT_820858 [Suillus discolor]|uniref:Uncharacterized protein n=1 Tax=Suillus discolor TaxID=1912936 RepID=A0A9P7EXA9_9AGAM|nr:uncharacterized protein F5147DRAFT_820858 [Suillus discolor]KAG2093716.1 hypothetical protein F5147DRAFT_820858 [Suillus discolor]
MTTEPSAVASTAPSVTHFSGISKEDKDNMEDEDSSDDEVDDGVDVTIGVDVDLHSEGLDIEAAVQDLAISTEQANVKAIVQGIEYLAIGDDNAGEDFTAALANVSSGEDSDDDAGSGTVPPRAKDSTEAPSAQPEHALGSIGPATEALVKIISLPKRPLRSIASSADATPPYSSEVSIPGDELGRLQKFGIDVSKISARTVNRRLFPHGLRKDIVEEFSPRFDPSASPALNNLNNHDVLQKIQCAYLEDYDLIVCRHLHNGEYCGYGVPLVELASHCFTLLGSLSVNNTTRHPHAVALLKHSASNKSNAQIDAIYADIIQVFPNVVLTNAELRALRPLANQRGPIKHIGKPVPGRKCSRCDYAWPDHIANKGFREHWHNHNVKCSHHGKTQVNVSRDSQAVEVQAFDRGLKRALYFAVRGGDSKVGSNSQKTGDLSILATELRRLMPAAADQGGRKLTKKAVGASEHIAPYEAAALCHLVSLPGKGERLLKWLQKAVVSRIEGLCEDVPQANLVIRKLLVKPRNGAKSLAERFNAPTCRHSRVAYASEEVRLLCFVLRCIAQKTYTLLPMGPESTVTTNGSYHLFLTNSQLEASAILQKLLTSSQEGCEDLTDAIHNILEQLYMPSNTLDMFQNRYISPVAAFVCLRAVHPDGGFITPELITPTTVRTQFDIRLFVMDFLDRQFSVYRKTVKSTVEADQGDLDVLKRGLRNPGKDWDQYCEDIIEEWTAEMKNTPCGFVREWIKSLSWIVRKTPTKAIVTWLDKDDKLSVRLLTHTVNIKQYHAAVQSTLQDCIAHVRAKVLFNITLPHSSLEVPSHDDQNEDARGYGLFAFSLDANDLGDSSVLLDSLSDLGTLCRWDDATNRISWDTAALSRWLVDVSLAWEYVYLLMHLLALPARGTEEEMWQHANGRESRRHLFFSSKLGTLVTKSNYNKSSALTGIYKTIIRVIPYEVAKVITILLRIVRPVEIAAILQLQCSTPAHKQEVTELYQTRIFVTLGQAWDSERMSLVLRTWFMRHLKVPFSMRLHRQFAQALQRKFLSYKGQNLLAEAANLAMGHTRQTGEMHYGRETEDLAVPVSLQEHFEVVGRDWIEWHGISTTQCTTAKK